MPIKVSDDPEVTCTGAELARYTEDWNRRFMMFAGPRPTLAAFIKREQEKARKADRTPMFNG